MSHDILFIADDFGLDADINAAIVEGHASGVLTGASLMLGQPATAAAVGLAHQQPTLQIGWHLHLCHSTPVTVAAWPWGVSPARAGWAIGRSRDARRLMRAEIAAQWEQFCATDLPCAFVNVHHHLQAHPTVYHELVRVLPRPFAGWIRLGGPRFFAPTLGQRLVGATDWLCWRRRRRHCPFACSDTLWGIDRLYGMRAAEVMSVMRQLPAGRHEFIFHPRRLIDDNDLACLIELRRSGIQAGQSCDRP